MQFNGKEYLKDLGNRILVSSKEIDLGAKWTPGPTPPNGHSPNALVGWVQNIFLHKREAHYFTDDDKYVETLFSEYRGQTIDSDDPKSAWYDPPRPYSDVLSPDMAKLVGTRPKRSSLGQHMSDKPQVTFPTVSPKGGKLYRFGGEINFVAYLMMMEPDGSKGSVLEFIEWQYDYAYSLRATSPEARDEFYERPTEFEEIYADTYVKSRGAGFGPATPKIDVRGPHGNPFFDQLQPIWESWQGDGDPYEDYFPSFK